MFIEMAILVDTASNPSRNIAAENGVVEKLLHRWRSQQNGFSLSELQRLVELLRLQNDQRQPEIQKAIDDWNTGTIKIAQRVETLHQEWQSVSDDFQSWREQLKEQKFSCLTASAARDSLLNRGPKEEQRSYAKSSVFDTAVSIVLREAKAGNLSVCLQLLIVAQDLAVYEKQKHKFDLAAEFLFKNLRFIFSSTRISLAVLVDSLLVLQNKYHINKESLQDEDSDEQTLLWAISLFHAERLDIISSEHDITKICNLALDTVISSARVLPSYAAKSLQLTDDQNWMDLLKRHLTPYQSSLFSEFIETEAVDAITKLYNQKSSIGMEKRLAGEVQRLNAQFLISASHILNTFIVSLRDIKSVNRLKGLFDILLTLESSIDSFNVEKIGLDIHTQFLTPNLCATIEQALVDACNDVLIEQNEFKAQLEQNLFTPIDETTKSSSTDDVIPAFHVYLKFNSEDDPKIDLRSDLNTGNPSLEIAEFATIDDFYRFCRRKGQNLKSVKSLLNENTVLTSAFFKQLLNNVRTKFDASMAANTKTLERCITECLDNILEGNCSKDDDSLDISEEHGNIENSGPNTKYARCLKLLSMTDIVRQEIVEDAFEEFAALSVSSASKNVAERLYDDLFKKIVSRYSTCHGAVTESAGTNDEKEMTDPELQISIWLSAAIFDFILAVCQNSQTLAISCISTELQKLLQDDERLVNNGVAIVKPGEQKISEASTETETEITTTIAVAQTDKLIDKLYLCTIFGLQESAKALISGESEATSIQETVNEFLTSTEGIHAVLLSAFKRD